MIKKLKSGQIPTRDHNNNNNIKMDLREIGWGGID
jgi:hypothetical protein